MNRILLFSLISLILAQIIKIFTIKPINVTNIFNSGGFPSSHTSLVVTLSTLLGLKYGFNSDMFSLALVFSLIVMYDARGVRRAVGEQANLLNQLIKHLNAKDENNAALLKEDLKELIGHTPVEVLGGLVLGIVIALGGWYFLF